MPTMTDSGGRAGAQSAEQDFSAYVAARQGALLRFGYLVAGDAHTAEDLVQTALAKTYLAWDRIREREALDTYVRRIIVNEHTSLWRRPWKRREDVTDSLPERPAPARDHRALHEELWTQLQGLPVRQRTAVVLRYYEQLTEAETADVMGCSIGTVKSTTSRALAALRARVSPDLLEDLS